MKIQQNRVNLSFQNLNKTRYTIVKTIMCHFDQKTILKTLQYDTLAGIGGICQLYWIRIKTKYIFLKHSPPHPSSRFIQISFCIGSRSNLTHPYTYDIQTLTIWSYTSFSYVGKIHKWSNTDFAFTFSLRRRLLGRLQNQKKDGMI